MVRESRLQIESEQLRIIYEMDRICDDTLDLDLLVRRLLGKIMDVFRADRAAIILLDDETQQPALAAQDGLADPAAFLEENRARIDDVLKEDDQRNRLTEHGARCLCKISMGKKAVGVLCIERSNDKPFTPRERALLVAIEGQIDNAIEHAKVHHRLTLRNKELETLYKIDSIRDSTNDLQEMLNKMLVELQTTLEAEMGFIMLYSEELKKLELKAIDDKGSGVLLRSEADLIHRVSDLAVKEARPLVWKPDAVGSPPVREALCAPLFLRDNLIGVFGVLNKTNGREFNKDDRRLLHAIVSQADTAIFEDARKALLTKLFKRFVSPQVAEAILRDPYRPYLEGEKKEITALFADLRGYSTAVADMDPKDVVSFLNDFLGAMAEIALENDGTLDKFIGDEVVALFGAPIGFPDHPLRAARAALQMQKKLQELNAGWSARGLPCFGMGIGVNSGPMVVGNVGGEVYLDYTAIGANMNLASRLQGIAKAGQILLSAGTYQLVRQVAEVEELGEVTVKGYSKGLRAYNLLRLRE